MSSDGLELNLKRAFLLRKTDKSGDEPKLIQTVIGLAGDDALIVVPGDVPSEIAEKILNQTATRDEVLATVPGAHDAQAGELE